MVADTTTEQRNFHHLVMNTVWLGLAMAATTRFLSVYAIRLGATPLELGMLASLPALTTLIAASLGARWLRRHNSATHAILLPALSNRLNYLLLIFTPFLPPAWQPAWVIGVMTLTALPAGIQSVAFLLMIREAVKHSLITPLISRRSMMMNITLGLSVLGFGLWLENVRFPVNYQAMYAAAFLMAMVSWWHLTRVRAQQPVAQPAPPPGRRLGFGQVWRHGGFQRVAVAAVATHIAYTALVPVIPLWLVNHLGANEEYIAYYSMAEMAGAVIVSLFTSRFAVRFGVRSLISAGMVGTALGALVLAVAPELILTLPAAMITGASWTAVTIGMMSFLAEQTPAEASYTTVYTQVLQLSMFVGPLLGSSLVDGGTGLATVLLFGALLRLSAGVILQLPGGLRRRLPAWRQAL